MAIQLHIITIILFDQLLNIFDLLTDMYYGYYEGSEDVNLVTERHENNGYVQRPEFGYIPSYVHFNSIQYRGEYTITIDATSSSLFVSFPVLVLCTSGSEILTLSDLQGNVLRTYTETDNGQEPEIFRHSLTLVYDRTGM